MRRRHGKKKGRFRKRFRKFKHGRSGKRRKMGKPSRLTFRKPTVLPDTYFCKLVYYEHVTGVGDGGLTSLRYRFRGNSCFDPNATGVGHQPLGFDQLCSATAFYSNYRVMGSKLECSQSTRTNAATTAAVMATTDSTYGPTNIDNMMEQPYVTKKWPKHTDGDGALPFKTKRYMSTAKVFGEKPSVIMSEAGYSATYAGSPAYQWYWLLAMQNIDHLTDLTWDFIVKITYYVQFFERNEIPQS